MIGRADIEGSKSNVAMNAWLPQASYPCDVPPQSNSPPDTVFRANRAPPEGDALKARNVTRRSRLTPAAGWKQEFAQSGTAPHPASCLSPTDPALRANPFPEVTDLVCRLPLPTLFYRPEAVHLGDLLRIWVRSRTKITPSPSGFSRADASSPDTTRDVVLYGAHVPISGRTDSRVAAPYQEKRTLPGTHASVSEFVCVAALGAEAPISVSRFGNINPIPFRTTGATRASPPLQNGVRLSLRVD
ncbi:unnamed protein product [Clavelina lepadiformis]|uniref:Uncharacterized protein n=1 Tax=Clavelina lepadiformis TaxID=159417 RepID=A0ABP0H456_CLALP